MEAMLAASVVLALAAGLILMGALAMTRRDLARARKRVQELAADYIAAEMRVLRLTLQLNCRGQACVDPSPIVTMHRKDNDA